MNFDTLLLHGTVIDGSGREPFRADVGICGGRIQAVGSLAEFHAEQEPDIKGLTVCPGMIDSHCHTDMYAAQFPDAEGKILQGVTTDICGLCGDSPAPVGTGHLESYRERQTYRLPGADEIQPVNFATYADGTMAGGNTTNMALFVGNTNLRVHALGYENRTAGPRELELMGGMLRESMEAGAFGLSTGLTYVPSGFADTEELIKLCKEMAPYGGIYNSHMRNEGDFVLQAIEEVIEIAEKSGCRGHISHLKVSGIKNHGMAGRCLDLIHQANDRGIPLTFDVYPYTAGSCGLKTLLPPDVLELGVESDADAMRKPVVYDKIRKGFLDTGWDNLLLSCGGDRITVAAAKGNVRYEGKTVHEIAENLKLDELDAVIEVLGETSGQASMVYHALCEADLTEFMRDPLCMIGTDAFARKFTGASAEGKPHPRNYGAFPRMIREYLLNQKVMPLEEGIRKMTSLPADWFGIPERGRIEPGYVADLLVFDPKTIGETGTYLQPVQRPDGIRWVFINGISVVGDGNFKDVRRGRVLKHSHVK